MSHKPTPVLVSVDIFLMSLRQESPMILVIQRQYAPYQGEWALPGGFVDDGETLSKAAYRELAEETGIQSPNLIPIQAFDTPDRDPRGRNISFLFGGLIDFQEPKAGDDAQDAVWRPLADCGPFAFDHDQMVRSALTYFSTLATGQNKWHEHPATHHLNREQQNQWQMQLAQKRLIETGGKSA